MTESAPSPATKHVPLLEVNQLNAWYGHAHILFDVSFSVNAGEVVALAGPNGAGKSTTIKAIMGMIPRRTGSVVFDGTAVSSLPSYRIARLGIGFVPEDRRIFTDLTVRENLATGRQPPRPGLPAWTEAKLFEMFPNLADMPNRRGQHMSGGEQQMLTIARTLMGNPRLVLLDEPSEGVAPIIVEQMAGVIADLRREGLSVLLSEQNERFIERVGARILRMEQGRLIG